MSSSKNSIAHLLEERGAQDTLTQSNCKDIMNSVSVDRRLLENDHNKPIVRPSPDLGVCLYN